MKDNSQVTITYGGKTYQYPVVHSTQGRHLIDISTFMQDIPLFIFDPGFKTTAAYKSSICYIDGERGILTYRGHNIVELANDYDFLHVCYLLVFGQLPDADTYYSFSTELQRGGEQAFSQREVLSKLDQKAHPMANLISLVASLTSAKSLAIPVTDRSLQTALMLELIGAMPVLVAMCQRHQQGLQPIAPHSDLSYTANFLYMLSGHMPSAKATKAMDVIFTLHAEHEQNASTSAVRSAGSTGTHPYAAIVAGLAALWGPAHGGANEACVTMLREIGSVDNIPAYIRKAKDKNDPFRLMGFGHRVYKNYDPRARVMQDLCHQLLADTEGKPLFTIAKKLESIALEDPYFIDRKLYPNVDFYSGLSLQALGIDTSCFTTIFSLARSSGWASHWLEMQSQTTPIIRPRQCYEGL